MRKTAYLLFSVTLIFITGCGSVKTFQSGRQGFFDELDWKDSAVKTSRERTKITDQKVLQLKKETRDWRWPLDENVITSGFGERGKSFHEGIDLRAAKGTPIYATADGKVVYAGNRISGYGRLIVLRHKEEILSVFAHLSKLKVKGGAEVKKGALIGYSGASGRATGPHLHFEIRKGVVAIDPQVLLPETDEKGVAISTDNSSQNIGGGDE